MAYFRCMGGSGGGGGGTTPTFTKTVIMDNSTLGNTLTFDDDYEDYDFLEFEVYNTSSDTSFKLMTTPEIISAIFANSSNLCAFNETDTNNYVTYSKSSNTWTRYGGRNLIVTKVTGWICSNMTVTKNELFDRGGIMATAVPITLSGDSFYNYDYVILASCTGTSDETTPCNYIFPSKSDAMGDYFGFILNRYNNYEIIKMSSTELTAGRYCYVQGVKFV